MRDYSWRAMDTSLVLHLQRVALRELE